jgi:hypothetical protein
MIRVCFWKEPNKDDIPTSEVVDVISSALACEAITGKYPNAVILFWEWV